MSWPDDDNKEGDSCDKEGEEDDKEGEDDDKEGEYDDEEEEYDRDDEEGEKAMGVRVGGSPEEPLDKIIVTSWTSAVQIRWEGEPEIPG